MNSAALIIIGDEILSGRTQDRNIQHIAGKMAEIGVPVKEVRVIEDDRRKIIDTVNALKGEYSYVFTTGGIGPTHDDITTASVAAAFGVPVAASAPARKMLEDYYGTDKLNDARLKMADMPEGAELIPNEISGAPGFRIENVYVMAGIPRIMQAMFEHVLAGIRPCGAILSQEVTVYAGESAIAADLSRLQEKFQEVKIGSYPFMPGESQPRLGTNIVFRCKDKPALETAVSELKEILGKRGGEWESG